MPYLKFNNSEDKLHNTKITRIDGHTVKVQGTTKNLSGFKLYLDNDKMVGDYSNFIHEYNQPDLEVNTYMYSDDNHEYIEPIQPEPPTPIEPTLEELKNSKIEEMNLIQQQVIENGVDVTFPDGRIERFQLTINDQISIMGLQAQVDAGNDKIPWHSADNNEHCKYYTNAEMQIIVNTVLPFVTYHVTYFRDLRIYINSLQTKDEVQTIYYGLYIPYSYQSEVLRDLYTIMGI